MYMQMDVHCTSSLNGRTHFFINALTEQPYTFENIISYMQYVRFYDTEDYFVRQQKQHAKPNKSK